MLKVLFTIVATALIAGCAATYSAPDAPRSANVSRKVSASQDQIMKAARQALVLEGYEIVSSDDVSGTLSTAQRNLHFTPAEANCGTTLGIDYLKDKRTDTSVAIGVVALNNMVTVHANVHGQYKPGAVDQNITLTCFSRGAVEATILDRIQELLAAKS